MSNNKGFTKGETKYYKLEKLVKWEYIDDVNSMLLNGVSPKQVSDWCNDKGFSISHPKLYEYKDLLQTAVTRHVTVERMLGIGVPKRSPIILQALSLESAKHMVKNEMEVLDFIIQKGMCSLLSTPEIKVEHALKAIDLKNKLTEGKHEGFTQYGLDQLRELETAKFDALVAVVLKYIDPSHIPELEEAIATAEHEFYENRAPEYLEQYEQDTQEQLEKLNEQRDLEDDIIVSDSTF